MPLHVLRLRDSDLGRLTSGDAFKAAVLLWCTAWHQVPASSLPDDDRLLASYSGLGSRWRKAKDEALRGFVKCSDGRLYHFLIAELAIKAAEARTSRRERTARATEARKRDVQRNDGRNGERDDDRNDARDDHQYKGNEGKGRISPSRDQRLPGPEVEHRRRPRQAHGQAPAQPAAWDDDAPFGRAAAGGGR